MSHLAQTPRLAGVVGLAAGLMACAGAATAQQADGLGLRTGERGYAAQQPAALPEPDLQQQTQALTSPGNGVGQQPGAVSSRAPSRASRPVQSPALRGVVQRQVRAPPPGIATLPPPAAPAPPPPRRRAPEEDPYAPLGLRLGNVVLRPSITNSLGYDTNPQRVSGPHSGSSFARYEGELGVQSDWNVHELRGRLRGDYTQYFRDSEASRPLGDGEMSLRLDATRDTRILLESRYRLDTQRPGSPDLTADVVGRPLTYAYGGSAGVTHDINRLQVNLRGSVDRNDYDDAELSNGTRLSQKDRNQTQYAARARLGYELTPGLVPYVQADIDQRHYDQKIDSSGYERSSRGVGGRVGSTFEISRLLTGDISVGYQDRAYEDPRLKNLRGPVGDASVLWTPTPLTTVTLRGSAQLGDTTIAGVSGTTTRRVELEVAHALRRNLTVTGFTTFGRTDYEGDGLREDYTAIGARLEYRLTRTFAVRTSFTHERLNSNQPGDDYTANVALVGLRIQF